MISKKISSSFNIARNIKAHDGVASTYNFKHVEIYNQTEQARIRSTLNEAIGMLKTGTLHPKALDFGCGTGNLTNHFLELLTNVVAGDVSPKSLEVLENTANNINYLTTAILNGKDLIEFADNSFDIVATYSVLHHVPDYLAIIDEFVRVTKPGGIILIDHEVCPTYWERNEKYRSYLSELGDNFANIYQLEMGDSNNKIPVAIATSRYFTKSSDFKKIFRYIFKLLSHQMSTSATIEDEGDIHTSKEDHIEWHKIKTRLLPHCTIRKQMDYLVCRENKYPPPIWNRWKRRCRDMRFIIAQKRPDV